MLAGWTCKYCAAPTHTTEDADAKIIGIRAAHAQVLISDVRKSLPVFAYMQYTKGVEKLKTVLLKF